DWSGVSTYTFRTASRDPNQMRSFVFGSCRYLLKLFGGTIWDDRGDKTFRAIADQIDAGIETDALLMLGDQIYADDLNAFDPDTQLSQFFARYRDHFTQPHQRSLMARIPTYMTLDDHEIEDNWPHKASHGDRTTLYPVALHSYLTYQASHSPLFELNPEGTRITGTPTKLWYSFRDGCCDFFITDTRTERQIDRRDRLQLISPQQMAALKAWLADGAEAVKLIGSAVPFIPDGVDPSEDKWSGFLDQRDDLLDWIREHQIRRVVFLSGDVHCSLVASLSCEHDREFQVISLISSAFFWPYPDRQYTEFQTEGAIVTHTPTHYRVNVHTPIVREDNFTRVTASLLGLTVETFSRKGLPLTHTTLPFV
ncbi:MAG: alkaline phosphatase family protein, partial [Oscillatoriales cyanobacterium]